MDILFVIHFPLEVWNIPEYVQTTPSFQFVELVPIICVILSILQIDISKIFLVIPPRITLDHD